MQNTATPPVQAPFVETVPESSSAVASTAKARVGTSFLRNIWYFAVRGEMLKPGKTTSKVMLGEPVLIGRDADGKPFALRDICPHQGIPLSEGPFDGRELQCAFHGWRFDTTGVCTDIPSLVGDQCMNVCAVKTKSYPCTEVQGNIWVYFGDKTDKLPDVPRAPRLDDGYFASTFTSFVVPNHFDYNALALLEPSHVPYVHKQWWWSRSGKSIKEKAKTFVPCETGWTMVQHKRPQQSFLLKLLGSEIDTEIGFRLPAYRLEHIVVGGKAVLSGMTILTPVDENSTEFIHITYWTAPLARFIAPLVRPFMDYCVSKFVGQDREMAIKQAKGLRFRPNLILNIKDSGTAGKWYFQLKDEWTEAHEQGRPFINPIKETILRWRT